MDPRLLYSRILVNCYKLSLETGKHLFNKKQYCLFIQFFYSTGLIGFTIKYFYSQQ